MGHLDHLALSVSDYEKLLRFYEQALEPLGVSKMMSFDNAGGKVSGFGSGQPFFWVGMGAGRAGACISHSAPKHARPWTPSMQRR